MKKFPLALKILIPVTVLIAVCLGYTGYILYENYLEYEEKTAERDAIDAIAPAEYVVEFSSQNIQREKGSAEEEGISYDEALATYEYENITFVSYSKAWDESGLEALCEELLLNTHGSEIDYLKEVIVYGQEDEDAIGLHESNFEQTGLPLYHYWMLPNDFTYYMPTITSTLTLYNGDEYTTVEEMAITLSHEYGHHFTLYYFTLTGDTEDIQNDDYFLLRYIEDMGIYYTDEDRYSWSEYLENHMWYMIEIAAEDYVYLMGSPTTRRQIEYMDTLEILKLDVKGYEDEIYEYNALSCENSFNMCPHENVALPLPDQVEGLAELFYGVIDLEAPVYEDRSELAESIEITVTRHVHSAMDKTYYSINWNRPWDDPDVTYTLVAYDENDKLIGAIKSYSGDSTKGAYIGSVVYETQNYYHWYNDDGWVSKGFLRFRIIVTFSDGTAVISPAFDKEF